MLSISGKVILGQKYGRVLGFPTANLDRREYLRKKLNIRFGVWAGKAIIGDKKYKAAIVIGPLDKSGLPKLEAHLLNFKGNLYGKKITISLHKYLRPFKKFKNINQLKKQIGLDVKKVKKYSPH